MKLASFKEEHRIVIHETLKHYLFDCESFDFILSLCSIYLSYRTEEMSFKRKICELPRKKE